MLYKGRFKNINEETIQVQIITQNDETEETSLTFVDESPVIISQSSDGLFSPIKSRSCEITIVTLAPYFDMYSGSSHGTKVIVHNLTTGECLFFGYLTPCEYNQPYTYLNELSLEAVDALSTLQDFKYSFQNGESSELVSVASVLEYSLKTVAGYPGKIYVPKVAMQMNKGKTGGFYPTQYEFIAEDLFMGEDEDDVMSYYEVLEEICKYFCLTAVPYGEDVYLLDYESIAKYDVEHEWLSASDELEFINILDGTHNMVSVPESITMEDYAGEDHDIELDEVYNKVKAEAETKEVEDDELVYEPMDVAGRSTYYKTEEWHTVGKNGKIYQALTRLFEFKNNKAENAFGRWQTHNNTNTLYGGSSLGWVVGPSFINQHESIAESRAEFPWPTGGQLNQIAGQTCLPAQLFVYEMTKAIPAKIDWDDMLIFFPQLQWLREFYTNRWTLTENWGTMYDYWWNFYTNACCRYPVLTYESKRDIQFSPANGDSRNYLCFKGDMLLQQNCTLDNFTYNIWMHEQNTHNYSGWLFPIKEAGGNNSYPIYQRAPGQTDYNKGWPQLKMKLQIGNKYWNGNSWVDTECTFWIKYHKENVSSENESIVYNDWMQPVTNHTYLSNINEEAFVIPISYEDGLHGILKFDIYMPFVHYTEGMFVTYNWPSEGQNYSWKGTDIIAGEVAPAPIDYFNYKLTPPAIFMKDLSLELVSAPVGNPWYNFKDLEDDDDIIYTNEIDSNNVIESSDLSFKLNTYNEKKPISQSYILEPLSFQSDERYYVASTSFVQNPNLKQFKDAYLNPKFAYEIYINEFDTEYFDYYAAWYNTNYPNFIWEGGYPAYVRVGEGEVHSCELQRYQDATSGQYVTVLRVGAFYDTQADALNDSTATAFYAAAVEAGQIEFITERYGDYLTPPPDDIYPATMKYETGTIDITKVDKVVYHSEGFYRPHTNEVKVEELNIIDRYVEHHTNPKKIYNCIVHGYYEPWKCISVNAINNLNMVVDEQEYDVKANTNELKLIEY